MAEGSSGALIEWDSTKAGLQNKLGELVQYFQVSVPTNGDGIPVAYIDPTTIAQTLLDVETPDDVSDTIVKEATTPIEFDEGYPTIGGIPLWERLDGEPVPYYNLFKQYREMKYIQGSRAIAKLADSSGMIGRHLNALARVYHWQLRTRAFDRFKEYEKQLARQQQVDQLETKHAKYANMMLEQAVNYLDNHPEQLSPKTAIQLAELAMRAGRLALGLNPDKPGEGGPTHATNITISQNNADNINQMHIGSAGHGIGAGANGHGAGGAGDMKHLQDILQVLTYSGALDMAKPKTPVSTSTPVGDNPIGPEIIDVDVDE